MKFLYINNELCTDCNKCTACCPTSAIYPADGKKYINYDKCISCGNCFRECTRQAISVEKIERIAREIDRLDELHARIHRLERENKKIREEIEGYRNGFSTLVQKLPVPVVVADAAGVIRFANPPFMDFISEESPGITGQNLKEYLPEEVWRLFQNTPFGAPTENHMVSIHGKRASVSTHFIRSRELVVGIIANLEVSFIANQETVRRIKTSIDRQMAMVQKIGFLLGEEVSDISKTLNSTLRIIDPNHDR